MASMADIGNKQATDGTSSAIDHATEDLWAEHREATARLERTEFHLIVASWNAGKSMDWIAGQAGKPNQRKSRTPIRHALYRADAMGLLRRPLTGGKTPYSDVDIAGDAGGQPATEQE